MMHSRDCDHLTRLLETRTYPLSEKRWSELNRQIVACEKCPRLRQHCTNVAEVKRKAFQHEKYWGRPVPNFGSFRADLLIVGLAPGAHGANRTGRMFTGDRSGDWLYRSLHRFGFANQAESTGKRDGLKLKNCAITNICRCAPPDNKPNRIELSACQPFFVETLAICNPKVILALGGLAWKATISQLIESEWINSTSPRPKFSHGSLATFFNDRWLLGSYHPSQQNTFTGRLTEVMLDAVFSQAQKLISK